MKVIRHVCIIIAALLLTLGLPFFTSDYFAAKVGAHGVDAVTGASVMIEKPSGEYLVFINEMLHPDEDKLAAWCDFFEGRDVSYIFEDISRFVANGDITGMEAALSFQSRLPENQMKITGEDATLLLSKAEYSKFDVIIMSKEFAQAYGVQSIYETQGVRICRVSDH
ncbi:MAG: hypothetical protein IJ833_03830 [Lachnospiraceae bacterium]|nr:hypothetical protein [Lachnospiraceae bacterium]